MAKYNPYLLTLQTDEIDHLTIRYTDFGEKLNKEKACNMIHFYVSAYDLVADAFRNESTCFCSLREKSESELYEMLVKIRSILLDMVFEEEK